MHGVERAAVDGGLEFVAMRVDGLPDSVGAVWDGRGGCIGLGAALAAGIASGAGIAAVGPASGGGLA